MKKIAQHFLLGAFVVTIGLFLTACGGSGGGSTPASSTSGTSSTTTSSTAAQPIVLAKNTLGLFTATTGGSASNFVGYDSSGNGLTVDSTQFLLSMVIPSTQQWVVLATETSVSYANSEMYAFMQDDQVFKVIDYGTQFEVDAIYPTGSTLPKFNPGTGYNPGHLGIVGNSMYYVSPTTWDTLTLAYDVGGNLSVLTGGKSTQLLSRTDLDNGATLDAADKGTLYAVFHNTTQMTLAVWTRNLTTGKRQTQLRNYTLSDDALYKNWGFKINDGILYVERVRISDGALQFLSTDLSVPLASATALQLLQTYTATDPNSFFSWGVDNGYLAFTFGSTFNNLSIKNGIAVLDVATNTTSTYDMGSSTQILGFVPLWLDGS